MFYAGKVTIDPSKTTILHTKEPTKIFQRLLYYLSCGGISEKEEEETFSAILILQLLVMGLKDLRIQNVLRIAKDDENIYLDTGGKDVDIKEAVDQFMTKVDKVSSESFKHLYFVVSEETISMKYIIEISVNRFHPQGEHPIKISVNGFLKEFKKTESESSDELKERMQKVFSNQKIYQDYIDQNKREFDSFLESMGHSIGKYIKNDEIKTESRIKVLRPRQKVSDKIFYEYQSGYSQPVFYGYHGYDEYMHYNWMWGSLCHENRIFVEDFDLVDQNGADVLRLNKEGFDANQNKTLVAGENFELPAVDQAIVFGNNDYTKDFEGVNFENLTSAQAEAIIESSLVANQVKANRKKRKSNSSDEVIDFGGDCSSCGSSCGGCSS